VKVRICTDLLSALCALKASLSAQHHVIFGQIWDVPQECKCLGLHFTMVWVLSHAGLRGNEDADEEVRLSGLMAQGEAEVDLPSAVTTI
jgi:ribonuclease HI